MDRMTQNPKVVGGITDQAAQRAERFYSQYIGAPVINVGTLEAAEMVKLAGMIYRDVNIALANELARYAELAGVDIVPVIKAANTDGEASILSPGIGVGGHCTPVYPHVLIADAKSRNLSLNLIETARDTNDDQPRLVLECLTKHFADLSSLRVLILGLGFRLSSRKLTILRHFHWQMKLKRMGAQVWLNDPLYTPQEVSEYGFRRGDFGDHWEGFDVIVLNTGHEIYRNLDFAKLFTTSAGMVIDGRNFWNPEIVKNSGLIYIGIGRGEKTMAQ